MAKPIVVTPQGRLFRFCGSKKLIDSRWHDNSARLWSASSPLALWFGGVFRKLTVVQMSSSVVTNCSTSQPTQGLQQFKILAEKNAQSRCQLLRSPRPSCPQGRERIKERVSGTKPQRCWNRRTSNVRPYLICPICLIRPTKL